MMVRFDHLIVAWPLEQTRIGDMKASWFLLADLEEFICPAIVLLLLIVALLTLIVCAERPRNQRHEQGGGTARNPQTSPRPPEQCPDCGHWLSPQDTRCPKCRCLFGLNGRTRPE
jgi:hypothetical protein